MKKILIIAGVIALVVGGAFGAYFGYGSSTFLNPSNEAQLIKFLTVDEDSPPPLIRKTKYVEDGQVFVVLYDSYAYGEKKLCLMQFTKNKYYINRYEYKGSGRMSYPSADAAMRLDQIAFDDEYIEKELRNEDGTEKMFFCVSAKISEGKTYEYTVKRDGEIIKSDKISNSDDDYLEVFSVDNLSEDLDSDNFWLDTIIFDYKVT